MSDRSYVLLEQRVCMVCGARYDIGSLLMDRRLRQRMDRYTTTGLGLCLEHQKLSDTGFAALIECDSEQAVSCASQAKVGLENARRTGRVAHLSRENFPKVFNVIIANDQPCVFVEHGVIEMLERMSAPG